MKLQSCLRPQRIFNVYTKEWQWVSCGKCAACTSLRQSVWVQRLEQEARCWKYTLFFTLTYNDDNVPKMDYDPSGFLYAKEQKHIAAGGKYPFISLETELRPTFENVTEYRAAVHDLSTMGHVKYLSVGDIQLFMKRLRRRLWTLHKTNKNQIYGKQTFSQASQVRYYICGEYGPTTFRPHYHGLLFFSSELSASHIESFIRAVWPYGFVDTSFVTNSASEYVAKYVNSTSHLPQVLRHKAIRPFTLFSKRPPIGSLAYNDKAVQRMFFDGSTTQIIFDRKKSAFDNVPLWRTFIDRLFPKISGFSQIPANDRIALYRVYEKVNRKSERNSTDLTSSQFVDLFVGKSKHLPWLPKVYYDYAQRICCLSKNTLLVLVRWYNVSARVYYQASAFGITTKEYVRYIDKFYDNLEKEKLRKQYNYEQEFTEKYPLASLVGIDRDFLRMCVDNSVGGLSCQEIEILQSFGVDVEKFCSPEDDVRLPYQAILWPDQSVEFLQYKEDIEICQRNSMKTRKKNEYVNPNIFASLSSSSYLSVDNALERERQRLNFERDFLEVEDV